MGCLTLLGTVLDRATPRKRLATVPMDLCCSRRGTVLTLHCTRFVVLVPLGSNRCSNFICHHSKCCRS